MKKRTKIGFNGKALNLALDTMRGAKSLNWKQVAEEAGVSASTLSRMTMGKNPDADSLARLVHWCGHRLQRCEGLDRARWSRLHGSRKQYGQAAGRRRKCRSQGVVG